MDDLGDIYSDKKGRRYFRANGPIKPSLKYDQKLSGINEEQISVASKKGDSIYGASVIPISRVELAQTHMVLTKPLSIENLLSDSGMHIVNPEEDLKDDYLF